jgi:hypothetical protein
MPIPPQVLAAGIGGGLGLVGSLAGIKAQKDSAKDAADQREAQMNLIQNFGNAAMESILPGYRRGQDVRQQALDNTLALQGDTFMPRMEAVKSGGYMGQQAQIAGLLGHRNALLGDPVNYGAYQPQSVPTNYTELAGLINPKSLTFPEMTMPEYSAGAELGLTPFNASAYLQANPDVAQYYEANKGKLIDDSGVDTFNSAEGYAQYHYDKFGRGENRPLTIQEAASRNQMAANPVTAPQQTTTAQATAAAPIFTTEQVQNIFKEMG